MRPSAIALLLTVLGVGTASTQGVDTYITGGSGSIDYLVARETIPQVSAGVLVRPFGDRLRIAGEADIFTSNGYFSGRGGPLAEVALVGRKARVQPFVRGGYFMGEDAAWIAGGGVDLWITDRTGIRVFVQDAFRGITLDYGNPGHHVFHEPAVQVGWVGR
jgi:hypothetical protein